MAPNPPELSNDILSAYADNELPEEEMNRLAPLIEADPEASAKVEEYRQTGAKLREFFSVDTPAETSPEIAQKIRAMGVADRPKDNVVALTSYRQRLSRGFKGLSSGAGLQKIAASLFIGVIVGIGGTSQFGNYNQAGVTDTSQVRVRGAPNPANETSNELELLYKRALAIDEKALGLEHPEVATNLHNLAVLYGNQGRYAEAEPLYMRALAITEKKLGPEHPSVAITLNNLASIYQGLGRYAEAEPLLKRALAINEKALGPEHLEVAITASNLASNYQNRGSYAELVLRSNLSTFPSGSTISKTGPYRIEIKVEDAETASLIYHEKNQAPVTLIDQKLIGSARTFKFPESAQNGIKIDTDASFVTFELTLEYQGRITRKYFVYGVK